MILTLLHTILSACPHPYRVPSSDVLTNLCEFQFLQKKIKHCTMLGLHDHHANHLNRMLHQLQCKIYCRHKYTQLCYYAMVIDVNVDNAF